MAKAKTKSETHVALDFPRTGNAWIDAGIVGLYRVLMGRPSYVKNPPGAATALASSQEFFQVSVDLHHDRLLVAGPTTQVQACLDKAYDRLVDSYFDISSKKQEEETKNYNFYFDSAQREFVRFPKKRPAGAALLLFDKAVRPAGRQEKWGPDPQTGKPVPGRLPVNLADLQGAFDTFLAQHNLKPGPPAGLLLDAPNEVRPKMKFKVDAKLGQDACFLTGTPKPGLTEAKNTAFPLFGGSRSFVSNTTENLRIGWQLDFVGKFVPAVAFFYLQGGDLYLFFPQTISLRRLDEMATTLATMVNLEPNLFRNFALHLGGYFTGRSEVTLAFLHRTFEELSKQTQATSAATSVASEEDAEALLTDPDSPNEEAGATTEPEIAISAKAVYDNALRGGEVAFAVVAATKKGNVWMARDYWTFHDVVYLARLFEKMQERQATRSGYVRVRCSPKAFMRALVDFEAKNGTVLRDKVCESILLKRSVLPLLEQHAFQIYTRSEPSKPRWVRPLCDFAILYEVERHEETDMKNEDYEKMVNRATWLGTNIADGVAQAMLDPERRESAGRAKGAFFRLRKTRTTADFLDELARLQNRYPKIGLPPEALDPIIFNHTSFEEFRGFCVVAALSRFQWKIQTR